MFLTMRPQEKAILIFNYQKKKIYRIVYFSSNILTNFNMDLRFFKKEIKFFDILDIFYQKFQFLYIRKSKHFGIKIKFN